MTRDEIVQEIENQVTEKVTRFIVPHFVYLGQEEWTVYSTPPKTEQLPLDFSKKSVDVGLKKPEKPVDAVPFYLFKTPHGTLKVLPSEEESEIRVE